VDGSGKIRVVKRDGSDEPFDPHRLARSMWLGMRGTGRRFYDACQLAAAVEIYLSRSGWHVVSSAALYEMTVKVLRRARLDEAATEIGRAHV